MLDVANKYETELQKLFMDTWYKDKYKYYHYTTYYDVYKNTTDTWNGNRFVSKDDKENILGYIAYDINRTCDKISGLCAINFSDNKVVFGKDLVQAIDDVFIKFNFRKLNFQVVIGNPIERSYDRLVKLCGGYIVGIKKSDTRLIDGKYYDSKIYEIMRDEYLKYKTIHKTI